MIFIIMKLFAVQKGGGGGGGGGRERERERERVSLFTIRSDIQTDQNLFMLRISIYYYVQVRICMLKRRFI